MSITEIEKLLGVVEQEIARLMAGRDAATKSHPIHALERIHGVFENDKAFQEATQLGRKWRDSQRPIPRKSKAKRK